MGWTVTASYELDDGNTPYDDQTVSIDTGNGTFHIQTNADKVVIQPCAKCIWFCIFLHSKSVTETGNHLADGEQVQLT